MMIAAGLGFLIQVSNATLKLGITILVNSLWPFLGNPIGWFLFWLL